MLFNVINYFSDLLHLIFQGNKNDIVNIDDLSVSEELKIKMGAQWMGKVFKSMARVLYYGVRIPHTNEYIIWLRNDLDDMVKLIIPVSLTAVLRANLNSEI